MNVVVKEVTGVATATTVFIILLYMMAIIGSAMSNASTLRESCENEQTGNVFLYDPWSAGTNGKCVKKEDL